MGRKLIAALAGTASVATMAACALVPPAQAEGRAVHVDRGWLTGAVSTEAEARAVPCPSQVSGDAAAAVGEWSTAGPVACFPKRSGTWHVDQLGECTARNDVTTGFRTVGTCVFVIDLGDHLKAWAPAGAALESFEIVWFD